MGKVPTYWERQKGRVLCRECREEMAARSMVGHTMTHHGRAEEAQRSWKDLFTEEEPRTYRMAFSAKGGPRSFPV